MATAAAAALYVTDRAGVQPVGRRLNPAHTGRWTLRPKQQHAVQVCRLLSPPIVLVIRWIATHIPSAEEWKAELGGMIDP